MRVEILVNDIGLEQNKTLAELFLKIGVSKAHINDIENNLKKSSLYVIVKLVNALHVKITELYKVRW